jgi:dephospho-CoA kinase/pantetheine-phosphate adenylyltransferase
MIKIGLTGSIGSGKSSVARAAAEELGIAIFDADKAVHDLYAQDKGLQAFLAEKFGDDILKDGAVDRKKLAQVMRTESLQKEWQETLAEVYKRLWEAYDVFTAAQEAKGAKYIIGDVPLLFESGAESHFDYTINVSLPYDVQKQRTLARQTPKLTEEEFEKRYKSFMPTEQRNKRADFVIDNSGEVEASLIQLRAHLSKMRDQDVAPAEPVSKTAQDFNEAAAYNEAVVYVGSFDPITLGHLDTIKAAAQLRFPKLYVAIGINPAKNPMFTVEERLKMIEREMDRDVRPYLRPGQEIIVTSYEGMTVDFMKKVGASVCIRGLRGVKDLEEEGDLAAINKALYAAGLDPGAAEFRQFYVGSDPARRHVSSTFARVLCKDGQDLALLNLVSPDVAAKMIEKRDLTAAHNAATPEDVKKIQALWNEFAPQQGESADKAYSKLARKYGEAHRKYHTVEHLAEVFGLFEQNRAALRDPQAVALALFFHDVVYNIPGGDNEERSAAYAQRTLTEMGADPQLISRVSGLITMTKSHTADANDTDAALMMDIDMAILGASPARYKKYAAAVEAEYTSHLTPQAYRAGRLEFLDACRKKNRFFITDAFETKYGDQTRRNLAGEESLLKKNRSAPAPRAARPAL